MRIKVLVGLFFYLPPSPTPADKRWTTGHSSLVCWPALSIFWIFHWVYLQGCSISGTPSLSQQHSGIISLYIMGIPPILTLFRGTHLMHHGLEMFHCWLSIMLLIRTLAVGFVTSCYTLPMTSWHFRSLPFFSRYVLTFYNSPYALCLFQAVITFLVHWYIFLSDPHQSLSSLLGAVFLCTEYTNVSRGIVFFF